jgi:carbamoyltransferase
MSVTLGLNFNHADSSACLFVDQKLKFAIEEERINRTKHWAGIPFESIKYALKENNIEFNDISNITVNTNPRSNLTNKIIFFLKNYISGKKKYEILNRFKKKLLLTNKLNNYFNKSNNNFKLHYVDHHISHISSAYYASTFNDAIGLSIDGFGDFCSLMIADCRDNKIKPIEKLYFPNSIGLLYEAFTQFIGFKKYGEEYKMMGLSSFGEPKYTEIIKNNLFNDFKNLKLNLKFFNHNKKNYLYNFEGEPNQSEIFNENIYNLFNKEFNSKNFKEDISASIQKIFEQLLNIILLNSKKKISSKNLVFAGGCALNSLANKSIYDSNYFNKIFIPYAPGDGGGSIGSALFYLSSKYKKSDYKNLKNPYIGPCFNNKQIEDAINARRLNYKYSVKFFKDKNELYKLLAKKIYENNIVGFFNGKMEFGARALGNRSILANPCSPDIKDIINLKIKKRENFRPFAPSILHEHKINWFGNSIENPYMSTVESILLDKRKMIPAVTHFDGTGRVQTVNKEYNLDFYFLINEFYKLTNVPILLNTSFNENEPIVMKPEHAIQCFIRTKMDVLVLENYMIIR